MQGDALRCGGVGRHVAGAALVDTGQGDAVAGGVLDVGGKPFHGGPVADIGRRHVQGQQMAQRVHRQVHLAAPLAPSYPARVPLSGVERGVRLSMMAAVGSCGRPEARRSRARRSCANASTHPAAISRRG